MTSGRFAAVALVLVFLPAVGAAEPLMTGGDFQVKVVNDIAYHDAPDADARKHKLDLYLPEGSKDFPVVFFIHGGGWSSGDRKLYTSFGRTFAKNGVGAVVLSYRLTPAVQHPGHIEDVARAFAWTRKNIATYGGRPDRIFVSGQSAGGHLAALLATNETYLKAVGLTPRDIRGVIPISGIYTFGGGRLRRVIGDAPEAAASASPLQHVSGREPPFLILYAENDFPGCDLMSEALDRALRAKSVTSSCVEIAGRNHISIIVRMMLDADDPTSQALLKFIAKHSDLTLKVKAAARPAN